jgi:hypothetical protein
MCRTCKCHHNNYYARWSNSSLRKSPNNFRVKKEFWTNYLFSVNVTFSFCVIYSFLPCVDGISLHRLMQRSSYWCFTRRTFIIRWMQMIDTCIWFILSYSWWNKLILKILLLNFYNGDWIINGQDTSDQSRNICRNYIYLIFRTIGCYFFFSDKLDAAYTPNAAYLLFY